MQIIFHSMGCNCQNSAENVKMQSNLRRSNSALYFDYPVKLVFRNDLAIRHYAVLFNFFCMSAMYKSYSWTQEISYGTAVSEGVDES